MSPFLQSVLLFLSFYDQMLLRHMTWIDRKLSSGLLWSAAPLMLLLSAPSSFWWRTWCTSPKFPMKHWRKNTFFFYQHPNCSQEHLDLIGSHNWNIHNFSGLEIKFPHCISLRFHTVDDIKHKADTSNCARQDCAHQYTYRNEGNRRLDPYSLILFPLLLG